MVKSIVGTGGLARLAWAQGLQALAASFLALGLVFFGAEDSDTAGLGWTLAARTAPILLVALIGGVIADKWSRSRVAASSAFAAAIVDVGLAFVIPVFGLDWRAQFLALIAGFATAVGAPSLYALLPSIVNKDNLVHGNAMVRSFRNVAGVVGPGLAAVIGAMLSYQVLLWIVVALNLVAGFLILSLRVTARAVAPTDIRNDSAGLKQTLAQNSWLFFAIPFWGVFLAIQSGAADVTQPLFIIKEHGPPTWAIMMSALTLGYVLGSLVSFRIKPQRLLTVSVLFAALALVQIISAITVDSVVLLAAASALTGVGFEVSGVLWGAALQTRVADEHMGRVSSFDYAISFGLAPIAYAIYGFFPLAQAVPVIGVSIVVLFVFVLVGTGISWRMDARYQARS